MLQQPNHIRRFLFRGSKPRDIGHCYRTLATDFLLSRIAKNKGPETRPRIFGAYQAVIPRLLMDCSLYITKLCPKFVIEGLTDGKRARASCNKKIAHSYIETVIRRAPPRIPGCARHHDTMGGRNPSGVTGGGHDRDRRSDAGHPDKSQTPALSDIMPETFSLAFAALEIYVAEHRRSAVTQYIWRIRAGID